MIKSLKSNKFILLSPLTTFVVLMCLCFTKNIYPFGDNLFAVFDTTSQFIPFLTEFTSKIKEAQTLLFSWHAGGGINFWADICYYLTSPFNFIALLFDENSMAEAYVVIAMTKILVSSFIFAIYLKKTYKKNDFSITLFSVIWSLSSFLLISTQYSMWLDPIIFMPLVMLGIQKMVNNEGSLLYMVSLAICIITNFYIGWMICIFSCVCFLYYMFLNDGFKINQKKNLNFKSLFKDSFLLGNFLKFLFSSLISGAISAVFILPVIPTFLNSGKGTVKFTTFNFTDIWSILFTNICPVNEESSMGSNVIFCSSSILIVILAVSFFFTKPILTKKKIANFGLIVFIWLAIVFKPILTAFSCFSEPAGLLYRFAFIYTFILIKIAYEAFIEIKNVHIAGIVSGLLFTTICISGYFFSSNLSNIFDNFNSIILLIILAIIYFIAIILIRNKNLNKNIILYALIFIFAIEALYFNSNVLNPEKIKDLTESNKIVEEVNSIKEDYEFLYYDVNYDVRGTVNNGFVLGFNDTSYYSSMANKNMSSSMYRLGAKGNHINLQSGAQEMSPIFNLIMPVKYYLDDKNIESSFYRQELKNFDSLKLYQNNYTMPLMYVTTDSVVDWNPLNYIVSVDNQLKAFKNLTGLDKDVLSYNNIDNFKFINCEEYKENSEESETLQLLNEFKRQKMHKFTYKIHNPNEPTIISFDCIATSDGIMYLNISKYAFDSAIAEINNKIINVSDDNRTYEIGEVKKGDVLKITFRCESYAIDDYTNSDDELLSYIKAVSYVVNEDIFIEGYNNLDSFSDTEILEFSERSIKAKVQSYIDGKLYIPIINDGGWTIKIDGNEVDTIEHGSSFIITEISKGEHTIEMSYTPKLFNEGLVVSVVSFIILICYAIVYCKRKFIYK